MTGIETSHYINTIRRFGMPGCMLEVGAAMGIFRKEGWGSDGWFINVCYIKKCASFNCAEQSIICF